MPELTQPAYMPPPAQEPSTAEIQLTPLLAPEDVMPELTQPAYAPPPAPAPVPVPEVVMPELTQPAYQPPPPKPLAAPFKPEDSALLAYIMEDDTYVIT